MEIKNSRLREVKEAGAKAFIDGSIDSYAKANRFAKKTYKQFSIERELFVLGWCDAYWNEQTRVKAPFPITHSRG